MRWSMLVLAGLLAPTCDAQVISRKKLLITVGAGANALSTTSDSALFATTANGGTFDFAFGYAITDRFTLGVHYQRMGYAGLPEPVAHLRVTSYQMEAGWAAWQRGASAVQVTAAIGGSVPAFNLDGKGLPATTNMSVFSLGGRYIHRFSDVLGVYAGVDLPRSGYAVLAIGDQPVTLASGGQVAMQWSAASLSAGVLIRF